MNTNLEAQLLQIDEQYITQAYGKPWAIRLSISTLLSFHP